jgi:hypothetical protein
MLIAEAGPVANGYGFVRSMTARGSGCCGQSERRRGL